MKSTQKQAIDKLNNLLPYLNSNLGQEIKNNVQILVQGLNNLDREFKQKTVEVQRKDQKLGELQGSIFDKEQKEFIEVLPQRYPHDYPTNFNEWPNDIWGKQVVERKDLNAIEKHLPTFKADLLKKEWIEVLHKRFPNDYPARFEDWNPNIWGKQVIDRNNIDTIKHWLPIYRQEIIENLKQSILSEKTAKENELKKLAVKEQETLELKEQLRLKELETQNKDQLLLAKELEKQELARLKEIEKEELLAQKEKEIHNKSLVKNQVIGELQGDIDFKEKEAYKLQIELLTKQLEFKSKESELKEKALADAHIINELQGKLLAVVDLHKEGKDIPNIELLKDQVNESVLSGNVDGMKEFSKYLRQLMKNPADKDESLDISELLNNLSPIVHGGENQVQNPLAVINNFDLNNINTTHSVYPSGEGSSFDIIQEESFN